MRPASLQLRLALVVGIGVAFLWLVAAIVTANLASRQISSLFDADLRATAERLLPLAIHDLRRNEDGEKDGEGEAKIGRFDTDDDVIGQQRQFTGAISYRISDPDGRVLVRSEGADDSIFPAPATRGFSETETHRLYMTTARNGISISVAEPLADRSSMTREMRISLAMPLLVLLPLSLLGIVVSVRGGLRPLRTMQQGLAMRGAQDLSPLPDTRLPRELRPFADAVNQLLSRLRSAFEAERSFAANAAHELRTPVAGAIAQTQRLRAETSDKTAARRATEIETTLKRLMRSSEKLMQLARAEGGRMRQETATDMRPVVRIITEDAARAAPGRCKLDLPSSPVLSVMEPDALGILVRNLIENALRHGSEGAPVEVTLTPEGHFSVTNAGAVLSESQIDRLGNRFEKGAETGGTGLGLAIVKTIAERAGARLAVLSPAPGRADGVSVRIDLPR